ncbi:FaeA/PapI family transcriptional regulator [Serratia sp. NA_112.1]|uniref:FaeA/PapI family transcriptional regulator n=1 Tax=unclassified Serratia (in: enterobacteria) TaxID=2647522 RepID=UPI00404698C9
MNTVFEQRIEGLSPVELLIEAVTQLCATQQGRNACAPETWPSTRDIAENCDFSIYKTRYLLMKMVAKGWIQVTPRPVKNTLRWYICPEINTQGFCGKKEEDLASHLKNRLPTVNPDVP